MTVQDNTITVEKSNKFLPFIPMDIDDYGFTPEEFRIYMRICRRALNEKSQGHTESVPSMSKALGIDHEVVRRALKVLVDCRAVTKTERPGFSPIFHLTSPDTWLPSSHLEEIRQRYFKKRVKATPQENHTPTVSHTPQENLRATPQENHSTPLRKTVGEGTQVRYTREGTQKELSTCVDLSPPNSSFDSKSVLFSEKHALPENKHPSRSPSPARQVFAHWQITLKHPKAVFTAEREKIINKWLKSYSVEELKLAVEGCTKSPFHMGDNDRHQRYDDLEVILKNSKNIEKFIALAEKESLDENDFYDSPLMHEKFDVVYS